MSKRTLADDDEDEDYMSDTILAAAAQASAPRLLNPRRRIPPSTAPPPLPPQKARRLIEVEQREQGLSTALSSENKGFQLMKKMGYTEGSKLGSVKSNGLVEPISIKIHPSRTGIGEASQKAEKVKMREELHARREHCIQSTYQDHLKQKYHLKRTQNDLYKCQAVCERLDREHLQMEESSLWKNETVKDDGSDDEDDDQLEDLESQLNKLTNYLRETHFYCIWCGQAFANRQELEETCPGNEKDLH